MEVVLLQQQLRGGCEPVNMASNLEWGSSSQDSDVLMIDPFLDYVNGILMDKGIDDVDDAATHLEQAGGTSSYQAIFSSLQDILADSATDDQLYITTEAPPSILQQDIEGVSKYQTIFSSLQDLIADSATDGQLHETTWAPLLRDQSLPATGHPQSNFLQESRYKSTDITLDLNQNKNAGRYNVRSSSSFKKDAAARHDHRSAIKEETHDGVLLMDAMMSCWGKDHALVEGLTGQIGQGHHAGGHMSKPPSADEQLSSKVAELDLSFEDLKLDDVYSSIYVAELSSSTVAGTSGKHNEDKRKSMQPRKGRFHEKHTSERPVIVDVKEVLISCAQAVAIGDAKGANEILQELHQVYGASVHGTGLQRMAYIFSRALAARMSGTGGQEFEAMSRDLPSSVAVLRASMLEFEVSPYQKVVHYFANQSILKAAEGASRLHIVDYGIKLGLQWPCLLNALADRKGGPPLLVITGIEFPQPGIDMAKKLAESGKRLAAYAKSHNVPLQFVGIVTDKWEDLDAASLLCSEAEVLVVNCVKRLRHFADDSTDLGSPNSWREKLFTRMHSLNPQLLVTAFVSAAHNSPFFVSRFCEALNFYSNVFDMLDTLWGDIPERLIMKKSYFYCYIISVIACEGAERVERPETYKQWHARITKAGFELLPIPATILERWKSHVKQHYHKDFLIHDDGKGWMLLGWKGRPTLGMSAWRPCHVC